MLKKQYELLVKSYFILKHNGCNRITIFSDTRGTFLQIRPSGFRTDILTVSLFVYHTTYDTLADPGFSRQVAPTDYLAKFLPKTA